MSTTSTISSSRSDSRKMLTAIVGIGVLCALLIVVTFEATLPRIERLQAEALEKAIFKVIPGITKTRTYKLKADDTFELVSETTKNETLVYAGYDEDNNLSGIAIEAIGKGYADNIRVLYGYSPKSETIIGFYVLESKETPGLGDKIEKDADFLDNFKALEVRLTEDDYSIVNPIMTVKKGQKQNPWELDGITGATISSRAIGDGLAKSTSVMVPLIFKQIEIFEIKNNTAKHE